jgi:hypothetical protein
MIRQWECWNGLPDLVFSGAGGTLRFRRNFVSFYDPPNLNKEVLGRGRNETSFERL